MCRRLALAAALALGAPLVLARPAIAQGDGPEPEGAASSERYRLVDMVVAEVGSTVVTLSELVSETRLVLLETRGPDLAWTADLTQPLLEAVLRSIVHRELLLAEVKRLQLRDPDPEDVERAVDALRRRFATNGDYDRFLERVGFRDAGADTAVTPPALAAILKAKMLAERFLDVRIRLNISASAEEIAACYARNTKALGGRRLAEVSSRIANRIRAEKEQRALADLITQLESRTNIVYLPPFERAPPVTVSDDLELKCLK